MQGVDARGCGQCLPCRIDHRRVWSHRIMLESTLHDDSAFVTLTYEDEKLPKNGSLNKEHIQKWLKRLRRDIQPQKIRYFLAGEYGDNSWRPHYHAALFGYPSCERGRTDHRLKRCCGPCEKLARTWGYGSVDVGQLEPESAQYIAKYVTKKLTQPDSDKNRKWRERTWTLLGKRIPEYAQMSLNPGIGAGVTDVLAKTIKGLPDPNLIDVPGSLRHSKKLMPLGRYLKRKLREKLGRSIDTPEYILMSCGFKNRDEIEKYVKENGWQNKNLKQINIDMNKQKILSIEAKQKIYESRGVI